MLCFKHRPIYGYTPHNFGKLRNHLNLQQVKKLVLVFNKVCSWNRNYAHWGSNLLHDKWVSKGYYCCSLFLCKGCHANPSIMKSIHSMETIIVVDIRKIRWIVQPWNVTDHMQVLFCCEEKNSSLPQFGSNI